MSDTFDSGSGGAPAADQGTPAQRLPRHRPGRLFHAEWRFPGDQVEQPCGTASRDRAVEFAQKGMTIPRKCRNWRGNDRNSNRPASSTTRPGRGPRLPAGPWKVEQYLHALRQQTGQAIQAAQQPGATEDELITAREMQAQLQQALAQQGSTRSSKSLRCAPSSRLISSPPGIRGTRFPHQRLDGAVRGIESHSTDSADPQGRGGGNGAPDHRRAKTFMIDVAKQHAVKCGTSSWRSASSKPRPDRRSPTASNLRGGSPMPPRPGISSPSMNGIQG